MEIFQTSLDKYEQQETKETTNKLVYLAQKNITCIYRLNYSKICTMDITSRSKQRKQQNYRRHITAAP
jgi:hypothetical protein